MNTIEEAKIALNKHSYFIIFLDNHLPDGMGIDFIPYIKRNFPSSKLVMITAYDTPADKNRAIQLGVDRFIGKPFTRDMINQTVDQLVELVN